MHGREKCRQGKRKVTEDSYKSPSGKSNGLYQTVTAIMERKKGTTRNFWINLEEGLSDQFDIKDKN